MIKPLRVSRLQTNTGFSTIEVLVGVGLLTLVALGVAESLSHMHGQLRGISQKQEIVELKNLITQQLAKPGVCTWQLKDQVIDVSMATTEASPSPSTLNLSEIHMGQDATSPVLVKSGLVIPESQSGLKVASILFRNIYATGNPNEYKGIFQVNFDSSSLSVPVKPLQIQQVFLTQAADPVNAKKIQSCKGGTGNIKVECMTASKQGKVAGMKWQYDNFSTPANLSDVFDVFEYPGGESAWGLACKPDYVQTTCSGSELATDTTMGPDIWQVQYGRLGCYSDNEELNGLDPTVYLTCCRFFTDS
jgi:hypothetical protein